MNRRATTILLLASAPAFGQDWVEVTIGTGIGNIPHLTTADLDGDGAPEIIAASRGSRAVRSFIEKNQPILAVSGHTHPSAGTDHIGETTLVNPGPLLKGQYAYIELTDTVKAHVRF